jgi:putative Mg2+ transporter-C (MgtC) family protein
MTGNEELDILLRIAIAILLSGAVGLERELAEKSAGLRTHMLVGGAAALLVDLGNLLVNDFSTTRQLTTDPIRIIEAIIVGISFLGAGMIFRRSGADTVVGLTTAASLLFTAGAAAAVGLNRFVLAIGATLLILFINRGLVYVEARLAHSG